MGLRSLAVTQLGEPFKVRSVRKLLLVCCVAISVSCSSTDKTSDVVVGGDASERVDVTSLCESIDSALLQAKWGDFGVKVADCGSTVSADGDDVFVLTFNDVEEWRDLYQAFGDIPVEDAARYAFWRIPLALLSVGFIVAEESPNELDQILILFDNAKQTAYDILPRDIEYVIGIPDSYSKEEFSTELNKRIDEVSLRVDVYNLNE
jgi:hypothetical protein